MVSVTTKLGEMSALLLVMLVNVMSADVISRRHRCERSSHIMAASRHVHFVPVFAIR